MLMSGSVMYANAWFRHGGRITNIQGLGVLNQHRIFGPASFGHNTKQVINRCEDASLYDKNTFCDIHDHKNVLTLI